MAVYGFTVARGDIHVSAIAKFQLKYTGDDAYYELLADSLRDGKVTIEAVTKPWRPTNPLPPSTAMRSGFRLR